MIGYEILQLLAISSCIKPKTCVSGNTSDSAGPRRLPHHECVSKPRLIHPRDHIGIGMPAPWPPIPRIGTVALQPPDQINGAFLTQPSEQNAMHLTSDLRPRVVGIVGFGQAVGQNHDILGDPAELPRERRVLDGDSDGWQW